MAQAGVGPQAKLPRRHAPHLGFNRVSCGPGVLCSGGSTALGTESFPSELLYKWKGDEDTQWCLEKALKATAGCTYAAPRNLTRQPVRKAEATPQPAAGWREREGPR